MRFGTGSYNVRHSEGLNPDILQNSSNSKQTLNCTIYFLDDTERTFTVGRGAIGQEMLDKVFEHLELVERDFFGLQFLSFLDSQAEHPRMRWLDPQKSIKKQMVCSPFNLYFRVKFYVSDPSKLAEEYTRYHFFLQVKRDLIEGRLICPESSAALLASYAIQSEIGDYNSSEPDNDYVENFKIIPNQSYELTKQIKELHKLHSGQTPAAAEYNFLDHAKRLDMYGVDLYEANIDDGIQLLVGVNSYGICLFQNAQKINAYPWCSIMKLTFKKKIFNVVIRILNELNEEEDKVFCFHVITSQSCKLLWKSCIEHHTFFRLIAPPIPPPKSIFSLGSRYRYSGRTEFQTMEEMKRRARVERAFMRANSRNNFSRATITGIGTRSCGSTSQQNNLEQITEREFNNLETTFDDADRGEYTLKSNNGIYNFKKYEDECMSNESVRNSITSHTSWVAKIFPSGHWKRKQNLLRKNFTLNKSLRINNNGSSTSNSSITSFFHRLIPKLESNKSNIEVRDDYVEKNHLRILNHRKIDEFDGLNYKKITKSESVAPSPSNTLDRKITNSKSHYSPIRNQKVGNNSDTTQTKHQIYDDNKISLRQNMNQRYNKNTPDSNLRRLSQPKETTFGVSGNDEDGITYCTGNWTVPQHNENYDSGISNGSNSYGYYQQPTNTGNDASLPSTLNKSTTSSSSKSPINNSSINTKNCQNNNITMHQNTISTGNNYKRPNISSNSSSTTSSTSSAYGTAGSYSSNNSHNNNAMYNNNSSNSSISNHTLTRNSNNPSRVTNSSTNPPNGSPYKNSPRISQQSGIVLNQMNGYSPRSSVASYSSYTSSNGLPSTNNQSYGGTSNASNNNNISNGTLTNNKTISKNLSSSSPVRQISSLSQRRSPNSGIKPINCSLVNNYFANPEENLVTIRMRPDLQGKFGFNVKGGADQDHPVIVSKVASGSSADKCYPRLNEGDQVIMINGEDVTHWTHDQVVRFIRSAKDTPTGELILNIKPNVYRYGEHEEPTSINIPEIKHVADNIPRKDMLKQSLRILQENLRNGVCVEQFETLYRVNPEMKMLDSKLSDNTSKNRYRDILPYDETRVRLQKNVSGDYINASHINIEIPSSGIINRYIACQGPLPTTCGDFWQMIWEQSCSTIVMLTTTIENGRVKCHQYWPRLYDSQDYGRLIVTCIKERETPNCSYREISIKDSQTKEERRVSQMQYTSWPDHGVPEDSKHFLDFVEEVRKTRHGSVDPMVVHCSAGIGRTGVLILMETAACKIEANEPIYPIEIVRKMRDQRAMLIQTTEQYIFVCDSILKAYDHRMFIPISEFHKLSR
ncbi:Protein-tyrosine phosphatase, receptor/non-receptor type domain and FERM domain and Protein-tyrosine/Dual specificity phosphatase domain and PDZ domain and Protein-tyrosine phosphatase, catalytic domain and Pleckstrin homology-like domain and FERM/acyl-CoA-binding protein, 3-helical bundle domain and FERM adjacent (FA) domain and FERM, N-terminal domain and FERM, C-terminal PH-like domain and FERM central domain and Band 4.1 domain and Band 4.1 family-containing protein [Strongyloides ratti]|uniref:protein-tyrosine-phosphatase n=1 Tax=Strongyloides ratti TaxID=34506 RepID=A0A090LBI6_STRRB|nr:Protein-tyrosine phosphatase, receptor/non-receptor type domain and FERM domain and Protein-tyrosine/Dual specificity phosphatase domain and PDZ domain and Protein-tyrosine phosphatase, catalytic domain and Pleckstrin homology-like domain and FERM/acyl-CoA-binding protein, 3-helical bundle domain and FERM adjacent (FA) domain and FERM, N-terminal domain and FERM, C-terminal PH-like domain and FERM central domain and Band 4.1 domain and Band 4.1 family-containing protein [Strongyloides ratti]CEF